MPGRARIVRVERHAALVGLPVSSGLHARLREATAVAHVALERALDWETRTATLAGYRDLLARFYGFHAACEPAIGQALDDEGFFAERRRLARLASDLSRLGLDDGALAALPRAPPIAVASPASALGALYVLEGSTLGGQVIGRAIERRHGAGVADACSYYRARGRATAAMWRAFCARLDALAGDSGAEAAALEAGCVTFDALRCWLVAGPGSGTRA